jgi:O-antigen/teichoic acid export membrane protein
MVLPPVIVLQLGGSAASAYFYVPWAVGTLLQLFANNMGTSMVAEGSFDQSKRLENLRLALIETARLLIPAVAVLCIGAPYFLRLLGAEYASNGVLLLRFVALAALPGIVVNLEIAFLRVTNRVGGVIAIDVALAVGTLGLSYAWLPRLGIAGVGLAMLASQTSVAVLLLLTELRVILSPGVPAGGAAPPGGTAL